MGTAAPSGLAEPAWRDGTRSMWPPMRHSSARTLGLPAISLSSLPRVCRKMSTPLLRNSYRPEMIRILVSAGNGRRRSFAAAARIRSRALSAAPRDTDRSGMPATSRPLGVTTSGERPRKFFASSPVMSLTAVRQSASRAQAASREYWAPQLWAPASRWGEMCSISA